LMSVPPEDLTRHLSGASGGRQERTDDAAG